MGRAEAARLRDSTQITLPVGALRELPESLESAFTVTIVERRGTARIIGSPVEIKRVSDFLARQGVHVH